jgi:hypothetical protein
MEYKKKFINSCDALLHARNYGETFGLTCGEFALELKPVITYSASKERHHIDTLGNQAILYDNYNLIYNILLTWRNEEHNMEGNGYLKYSPENVMQIFKSVYLLPHPST